MTPIGTNLSELMGFYDGKAVRPCGAGVAWRDGWGPLRSPLLGKYVSCAWCCTDQGDRKGIETN